MKLLKNERAYIRFAAALNRSQPQCHPVPPVEFPCFVYLTTASFGYEEENENYLYADDIARMQRQLAKASK